MGKHGNVAPFFMKQRPSYAIAASLMVFCLASCAGIVPKGSLDFSYLPASTTLTKKAVSAITYSDFAFQSQGGTGDSLPSVGKSKTLVIPVEFSDYPFSSQALADLEVAFNGTSEQTKYWESVSSFYEKSSFGQLSLTAHLAPVYSSGKKAVDLLSESNRNDVLPSAVVSLLRSAVANFKNSGDSCKDFDINGNGLIDGVYLIYSCPDYLSASKNGNTEIAARQGYWAFTARDTQASANLDSPAASLFTWASYDFMYRGTATGVDAHTYIHETGHLLGLDDLYSYTANDDSYTNAKYKYYLPTGALDMMDYNLLDHNVWNKLALGWTAPYVLSDDLSYPLTVELDESQWAGDCLLIPARGQSYNGTAFDEYLLVELYTPDGLNQLDASTSYASYYPLGFSMPGVKISHVDARLARCSGAQFDYLSDLSSFKSDVQKSTRSSYYRVAASNTPNRSSVEGYRLLHLLEAKGSNTLQNANYQSCASAYGEGNALFYANNGSLFAPDDEHYFFAMNRFASFFERSKIIDSSTIPLFNNGAEFGYEIRVNGIQSRLVDGVSRYQTSLTITKA